VGSFQQEDAAGAELVVGGEENAQRPEDDEREEVEGRVKVGEAIASRGLEHVHAVDVEVLLAGVGDDSREAVGEHTGERTHEKDGAEGDEDDHERRAENGIDLVHDVEADVAGPEENLGENHGHFGQIEMVSSDEREGCQEAKIDNDD
jgi:hypothetical protein